MPNLPAPLTSLSALEQAFSEGLAEMLEKHRGLGVTILVLANAAFDAALWQRLAAPLAERHAELAATITATLRRGGRLDEPDDDVLVFLKLLAIGFERLQTTQHRRAGPWNLSFNPIRALRPPRMSEAKVAQLLRPFDPAGFHFNKPFLAREVLWEGELAGKAARLLYNKFPFARLHGLLVPEPARELPQFLTPELHGWAWDVSAQAGAAVPGFCLAYNSYGALASVNHLHFQSFVQEGPLPVQDAAFIHNGGELAYPLPCRCFTDRQAAWFHLDELHSQGTPYNLIYAADCLHVLARAPQGSRAQAAWNPGFGWSELAGTITLFSREEFERLSETEIAAELANQAP
ncbi:MAG: hypothetical protein Q8O79_02740 [Pseudomonadota bacterium]|nr:hypothetical protein [Pseudomonadota bacterium]